MRTGPHVFQAWRGLLRDIHGLSAGEGLSNPVSIVSLQNRHPLIRFEGIMKQIQGVDKANALPLKQSRHVMISDS